MGVRRADADEEQTQRVAVPRTIEGGGRNPHASFLEARLSEVQQQCRGRAVRLASKRLAAERGLAQEAEDVVQEVNWGLLCALRTGNLGPSLRAFGRWPEGQGAPTSYYWASVRNGARDCVRAHRRRARHEMRSGTQAPPGARAPQRACAPAARLARLSPVLAAAIQQLWRFGGDGCLAALALDVSETELRRRVGWARAHLDDRGGVLPPKAGVTAGWLRTQRGALRDHALRLLERSGWPDLLWTQEVGGRWATVQRARQRARLRGSRHDTRRDVRPGPSDSCREAGSAGVGGDGGRDPSATPDDR